MVESIDSTGKWRRLASAAAVTFVGLTMGCGGADLSSTWRDREVSIDGENTEWLGTTTNFRDHGVTVGVMNDEEYVYLSLFVGDRLKQAQMMALGCTVWFDPSGGEERTLGIHYPLGSPGNEREILRTIGQNPDSALLEKMFADIPREFELLGPGPGSDRMQLGGGDIEVAAKLYGSSLIYEIKVPLEHGGKHPYAIGAQPGEKFEVALVTPEIEHPAPEMASSTGGGGRRGGGGSRGGGGRGGGGRGGGSRGGDASASSRPAVPEPLNVKATIQLDKPATSG